MNQNTKEFRKNLADTFVKALSEKQLDWKKGWNAVGQERPINAVTGKPYKGLNRFMLAMMNEMSIQEGLPADNRWATFYQVQQKGWKLKKGCHGCKVEYWEPHDFEQKKRIDWEEYLKKSKEENSNVGIIAKYFTVFNGRDIEGLPELEKLPIEKQAVNDEMIVKISSGMGVSIEHGGANAYYNGSSDRIYLPLKEAFFSEYEYNATALHELSHATGAPERLNRKQGNGFGSPEYAYEELVAEISSSFMGEHLQFEQTKEHIQNHIAYVQSWIQSIQNEPDILIRAIREAENAANLLEYHAGILTKEAYQKTLGESMEIPTAKVKNVEQEKPDSGRKKVKQREAELLRNGFRSTPELLKHMDKLSVLTGKEYSLKEIHAILQNHSLKENPDAEKVVQSIGKMLQKQELCKLSQVPTR